MAPLAKSFVAYGLLALLVMLPMLWPGYILTLDMVFTPELRMPEQMSSSYLFHAGLHYLNFLLPSDVIQKIMLLAILVMSGLGMHYLTRHIQTSKNEPNEFAMWGAFVAGALYMINPFVYSRFMAGQYAVLLGYALLPFFARAMLKFFAVPTLKRAMMLSGWLVAIGIISVHTLGLAVVLIAATFAVCAWRHRENYRITMATAALGSLGLLTFVTASGYWLFPLLQGTSNQGQAVANFSTEDQKAFATVGGDVTGQLGNILQLQGFWAEGEGLYLLPQDQLPVWAVAVLAIWTLVGVGARWLWKRQRAMAVLFIGASAVAIILAIAGVPEWLPGSAGFREPHKFVGLLALTYALFAGLGAAAALNWARRKRGQFAFNTLAVLIILLPAVFTPTMFWGFSGQLSPRQYPADWHRINEKLNQDKDEFRVLSLPWHLYMHYQFAGRIIVNPSDKFFDKPTITSNELEFKNASPTFPNAAKKLLTKQIIPSAPGRTDLGKQLSELDIKYVLLAKTFDYKDYAYLGLQTDLELIEETPNLKLYRNFAYGK